MKILILNPRISADSEMLSEFRKRKIAMLQPDNAEEAWQMLKLHGRSVDLAIINREGGPGQSPEEGLRFVVRFKADSEESDLPWVMTSDVWDSAKFTQHQKGPLAANAYLRWPYSINTIFDTIDAIFKTSTPPQLGIEPPIANPANSVKLSGSHDTSEQPGTSGPPGPLLVEETSVLIHKESNDFEIVLEGPNEALVNGSSKSPVQQLPQQQELQQHLPEQHPEQYVNVTPPENFGIIKLSETKALSEHSNTDTNNLPFVAMPESSQKEEQVAETPHLSENTSKVEVQAEIDEKPAFTHEPGILDLRRTLSVADALAQPVDDSVIPGGTVKSPDLETLKMYLLLREQDVAVLSAQVKTLKQQVAVTEEDLKAERSKNVELIYTLKEYQRKTEQFEKEKATATNALLSENNDLKFQLKTKTDTVKILEGNIIEIHNETERLKERVKYDIRKIKVREKELENQLEISRKDSEVLLQARESRIIELKRKVDLLEFNMDLLQDRCTREKDNSTKLRERLAKAAQVVRVVGGVLDQSESGIAAELGSRHEAETKSSATEPHVKQESFVLDGMLHGDDKPPQTKKEAS